MAPVAAPAVDLVAALTPEQLEQLAAATDLLTVKRTLQELSNTATERICDQLQEQGWLKRRRTVDAHVPRNEEERELLNWVWNRWRLEMGYSRVVLTDLRAKCILQRYREKRTREEFEAILVWASKDPWMSGKDPRGQGVRYDDIHHLFGSKDKFDKYLARAQTPRSGAPLRAGAPAREPRRL